MNDLALAAGISRSSLYYYFTTKRDVLSFVQRSAQQELKRKTAAVAAGGGDVWERLDEVIRLVLDHIVSHPWLSRPLLRQLVRSSPDDTVSAHPAQDAIRRLLEEGVAKGFIRPLPSVDRAADSLAGALLMVGLRLDGTSVAQLTSSIDALLRHGIAPASIL